MNECTIELKLELVAQQSFGCMGCVLADNPAACQAAPPCSAGLREDRRNIIWVEKSE